jgi:NADPH-dependent 2,4-dienoyl-CoA reductase/sulfur reductase-like enzyme
VRRGATVQVTGKRSDPGTVRPRARREASPASVAIIGAGAAGNSCAEELRKLGFQGAVVMVDPDAGAPYDRPNLSKDYLAGNAPEEWIPLHPPEHYTEKRIEFVPQRVTRLEPVAKMLEFENGTSREFGAIVLATGAEPVRPELPGNGPPVYTLRSLQDSRSIIAAATAGQQAVVLGASFIGLEVAAALRTRELGVHVVAPGGRPLEKVLGPEFGDFVRGLHESHGVVFHLGRKATRLESGHVVLDDGTRLGADFVVAGIGVRPRLDLAQQAGLRVDNGIVVNEYLETSAPGVFAIGDAARYPNPRRAGETLRIEHWVHAERMGQAAARNVAGLRQPFVDVPFFWSQHYDIAIAYVGHAERWDAIEIDGRMEQHDCIVRYRENGKIAAAASIFRDRDNLEAEVAMERETPGR